MIVTECTKCCREIRAENQYAGRIARCPGCSHPVELPKLESGQLETPAPRPTDGLSSTGRKGLRRKRRSRSASTSSGVHWEVRRIRILHSGLFGLVAGGMLGGLFLLLGMIGILLGGSAGVSGGIVGLLVMSIGCAVMVGVQGMLGAILYNVVASMTGGYRVQLQTTT